MTVRPSGQPTLVAHRVKGGKSAAGKAAICPFCDHVHPKAVPHPAVRRRARARDALLVAADLDDAVGKTFREPTLAERVAVADAAEDALADRARLREPVCQPCRMSVIPAGNSDTVQPVRLWREDLRRPLQRATDPRLRALGARHLRSRRRADRGARAQRDYAAALDRLRHRPSWCASSSAPRGGWRCSHATTAKSTVS